MIRLDQGRHMIRLDQAWAACAAASSFAFVAGLLVGLLVANG